jgi:hypothetical protein
MNEAVTKRLKVTSEKRGPQSLPQQGHYYGHVRNVSYVEKEEMEGTIELASKLEFGPVLVMAEKEYVSFLLLEPESPKWKG